MKSVLISLKQTKFQLAIVIVLTAVVYLNSIGNHFVWDDHLFVEQWPAIRSFENIGAIFKGAAPEAQGKIYRPIRGLIYMIDWQMFGDNPVGYRVQAVLLHISVTVLIYLVVKQISADLLRISADKKGTEGQRDRVHRVDRGTSSKVSLYPLSTLSLRPFVPNFLPFVAALIFGLHPIHTETIDYISTSLETFGSLFFFGSFYLYLLASNARGPVSRFLPVSARSKLKSKRDQQDNVELRAVGNPPTTATPRILARSSEEVFALRVASVALAILAFFTYEMTVTLPVLLVLYEWTIGRGTERHRDRVHRVDRGTSSKVSLYPLSTLSLRPFVPNFLPYFGVAIAFVAVRTMILGLVARSDYLAYSFYLTMVTMAKVFVRYVGLLILPVNQTAIHNLAGDFPSSMVPYDKLDPILNQTIFDLPVILSLVLIAVSIIVAIKLVKLYPIVSFGILWFWISLLPVSYIIPHGGAMAEKYLYIASFGLILAAVGIYANIMRILTRIDANIYKPALIFVGLVLFLFYSVSTVARNRVWANDITLFSDVVKKSPNNLIANYTLGIWYARAGNFDASDAHYLRAIDKAPEFWEARFNLANNYLRNNEAEKAKEQYKYVLNIYPEHKPAKNILANISLVLESSPSAQPIGDLVVHYGTEKGLKFSFPAYWSIDTKSAKSEDAKVILKDAEETLNMEISDAKSYSGDVSDFIKSQKQEFGTLVNQGLAQIPSVEQAFVKVWEGASQSQSEKSKSEGQRDPSTTLRVNSGTKDKEYIKAGEVMLQFFMFKEKKVVEILVWPVPQGGSVAMSQFDGILGSVQVDAD